MALVLVCVCVSGLLALLSFALWHCSLIMHTHTHARTCTLAGTTPGPGHGPLFIGGEDARPHGVVHARMIDTGEGESGRYAVVVNKSVCFAAVLHLVCKCIISVASLDVQNFLACEDTCARHICSRARSKTKEICYP